MDHWSVKRQGDGTSGTVTKIRQLDKSWRLPVLVRWDNGDVNSYKAGKDGVWDILRNYDESCEPVTIHPSDTPFTSRKTSDGGTSEYYFLPEGATELRHLISHKEMSFARGNIFKALWRLGEKEGVDIEYDLNKIKFFAEELIEMHKKGQWV